MKPVRNKRPRGAFFVSAAMSFRDVAKALWRQRLAGLMPAFIILFLLALILSFLTAISPIAPFVYPLF